MSEGKGRTKEIILCEFGMKRCKLSRLEKFSSVLIIKQR